MKVLILILAVVVTTLLNSCGVGHSFHVSKRVFKVADPQQLLSEDPENPGSFFVSQDSLIIQLKRVYFGYDTGDKTIFSSKKIKRIEHSN